MFVLNAYEKELCEKGNILLWNIIINAAAETGYYINKAGERMYVVLDMRDPSHHEGYVVTSRMEDGEEVGYMGYFINGVLENDVFESDPSFLPAECPMIIECVNTPVVTVITGFDHTNGISFTHKGVGYMTSVDDEFEPDNYEWWGSFILNAIPNMSEE